MEDCFPLRDWRTSSPCYIIPMIRHTPPRTKIVMFLLCVSAPATEIPSYTMAKNLYKSSTSSAAYWRPFLHSPAELRSNFVFFVPFLLPFALFGLNTMLCGKAFETSWTMWIQYLQIEQMSTQDSRHWMSTWMFLCFGGVYYSHRSTLGTTASWGSMDAAGCCWDAPGWSWLLLVGPPPCFSISPEVAPVCPGAVQSRRGGPCIKGSSVRFELIYLN